MGREPARPGSQAIVCTCTSQQHMHAYFIQGGWRLVTVDTVHLSLLLSHRSDCASLVTCSYFLTQDGTSPLVLASQNGHSDVVNILIRNGADINLANKVWRLYHTLIHCNYSRLPQGLQTQSHCDHKVVSPWLASCGDSRGCDNSD